MCGIFGKLYFGQNKQNEADIERSLNSLRLLEHRGPDHMGYYVDNHIFLGSTRLSIVDRSSKGNMPISNEDSSIIGVLNGEIYNFKQLKRSLKKDHIFKSESDTEVMIHLYEEMGISFLKELKGMFALALWDKKRKLILIARDRLGKKPMIYSLSHSSFVFSSEIKAIVSDPEIKKKISLKALGLYFNLNYIPAPHTIYENLRKLEPGSYMVINNQGKADISRYWEAEIPNQTTLPYPDAKKQTLSLIKKAVEQRIPKDCDFGVHLSGGVDSSLITALSTTITGKRIQTFSVGFEGNHQDESSYAQLVSQKYNTQHHEFVINEEIIKDIPTAALCFDEPFADPSLLPTWKLCQESSKYARIALNGDGGDELFGGYQRYQHFHWSKLPYFRLIARLYPQSLLPNSKLGEFVSHMKLGSNYDFYLSRIRAYSIRRNGIDDNNRLLSSELRKYWKTDLSLLERPEFFDSSTYLPNDLLVKTDMLGMRFGQEIRSPLLDDDLFTLSMNLPHKYKVNAFNTKILLKNITQSLVPPQIIRRRKQGFAFPLEWLHAEKNDAFIRDILLSKSSLSDHISISEIKRLIDHKKEHGNTQRLWQLIILQLWFLKRA